MKFSKKYQEYLEHQKKPLPGVGLKKLKKILKKCKCRREVQLQRERDINGVLNAASTCPHQCTVCDGTFFPSLLNEMSTIVACFNKQVQKLLKQHLASGFRKFFMWKRRNHVALIQEGKDLVTYAMINAIAIRKILKKYDKIHCSIQGQAFFSQAQSRHIEILQSPWLCELMAFQINLRETNAKIKAVSGLCDGCSLMFDDGKPSLSCTMFASVKLNVEFTCSICLDTLFDPVSLTCGHIFCHICACSAASVTIVDGLKAADPKAKCPLCREMQTQESPVSGPHFGLLSNPKCIAGVFEGSVSLEELNILLSRSCHEYWKQRLQTERRVRVKQAKEHWESQCRAFIGV